jgi:hypothetical protein
MMKRSSFGRSGSVASSSERPDNPFTAILFTFTAGSRIWESNTELLWRICSCLHSESWETYHSAVRARQYHSLTHENESAYLACR